jgi:hypothetical protein
VWPEKVDEYSLDSVFGSVKQSDERAFYPAGGERGRGLLVIIEHAAYATCMLSVPLAGQRDAAAMMNPGP